MDADEEQQELQDQIMRYRMMSTTSPIHSHSVSYTTSSQN